MRFITKMALKSLLIVAASIAVFLSIYYFNNRLFLFEAHWKWPQTVLKIDKFKEGSANDRASMVVDLVENGRFQGKDCGLTRKELGDSNGDYYYSDSNITYALTEKPSANWILTFICGENGTVEKVFIRKSCCSITRKIFDFAMIKSMDLFF